MTADVLTTDFFLKSSSKVTVPLYLPARRRVTLMPWRPGSSRRRVTVRRLGPLSLTVTLAGSTRRKLIVIEVPRG